jgi:hypothetical protein
MTFIDFIINITHALGIDVLMHKPGIWIDIILIWLVFFIIHIISSPRDGYM